MTRMSKEDAERVATAIRGELPLAEVQVDEYGGGFHVWTTARREFGVVGSFTVFPTREVALGIGFNRPSLGFPSRGALSGRDWQERTARDAATWFRDAVGD